MPYFVCSALLLLIACPAIGTTAAVWLLAGSQLLLLLREIRSGQVTGAGGFIFMSFLFFSVRPLYIVLEKDYTLFTRLFLLRVDLEIITEAMWWASIALWCFALGAFAAPRIHARFFRRRRDLNAATDGELKLTNKQTFLLLWFQVATLPVMWFLATQGSLYRSGLGAYLYDFPVLLQSVNIFAVVVIFSKFVRLKNLSSGSVLLISGMLLLVMTWLMRDVSNFRGFYLTGLFVAVIAVLSVMKSRVGYMWLILPVVLLQPFFAYLGEARTLANEELLEGGLLEEVVPEKGLGKAYWNFYRSSGDMNIFDTFVAAKQSEPRFKPYALSWLYVPLHFIPRALWKGKPERGITMDLGFLRGAPYAPGIAGFFLLDGGLWWMLLSMALLGYLLSCADWWVLTLRRGYVRYCLIAILAVNGMTLSRFFLWQYFYQVLYYVIPIAALFWWLSRSQAQGKRTRQLHKCPIRPVEAGRGGGANPPVMNVKRG